MLVSFWVTLPPGLTLKMLVMHQDLCGISWLIGPLFEGRMLLLLAHTIAAIQVKCALELKQMVREIVSSPLPGTCLGSIYFKANVFRIFLVFGSPQKMIIVENIYPYE